MSTSEGILGTGEQCHAECSSLGDELGFVAEPQLTWARPQCGDGLACRSSWLPLLCGFQLSSFVFQADEPIADYAAMDDVMQGKDEFILGIC